MTSMIEKASATHDKNEADGVEVLLVLYKGMQHHFSTSQLVVTFFIVTVKHFSDKICI